MRILVKNDSNKTFFDNYVDTGQICMGFKTDTPEKIRQHEHLMRISNKDLIEKLLTTKHIFSARDLQSKVIEQESWL